MGNSEEEQVRPSLSVLPSPLPPEAPESDTGLSEQISPSNGPELRTLPINNEFLWKTHDYIGEYVRFSDAKAAIALTISSALLGALWSAKAHDVFLTIPIRGWGGLAFVAFVACAALAASMIAGIFAIAPRFWSSSSKNPIFWDGIGKYGSAEVYFDWFKSQDSASLAKELAHQVFSLAAVCSAKYKSTTWSIYFLIFGAFSCAIFFLAR